MCELTVDIVLLEPSALDSMLHGFWDYGPEDQRFT